MSASLSHSHAWLCISKGLQHFRVKFRASDTVTSSPMHSCNCQVSKCRIGDDDLGPAAWINKYMGNATAAESQLSSVLEDSIVLIAYMTCVQAEHEYTLRELSSVKGTLQMRNNDLHDLESRLQDQEAAACECLPVFPISLVICQEEMDSEALLPAPMGFKMFPDFSAEQIVIIVPGSCCRWSISARHMLLLSCLPPTSTLADLHSCAL